MAPNLADQIAIEQLSPGEFVSSHLPIRMGNSMPIAYGGCTVAVAVNAAYTTIGPDFSLYSLLGHFHGPASTQQKLYASVVRTRDTRSFATRRVQVKQKLPDGSFRACLELMADFHVREPEVLEYSAPTRTAWPGPEECPTVGEHAAALRNEGKVTDEQYEALRATFATSEDYFETRYCVDGVSGQNLSGVAKTAPTSQDHLPITAKTSAEWQRARGDLPSGDAHMAALAFLMDGALAFLPLTHGGMWFDDVGACSTLDFALRVFVPSVDMGEWHLRERSTSRGGGGRTFSEGSLWDEEGRLVATASQQSILRVKRKL